MRASELREMETNKLIEMEEEYRADMMQLRFKLSTGELEDTSRLKKTRKDIARIKTILWERKKQEVANGK